MDGSRRLLRRYAKMLTQKDIPTFIANGKRSNVIIDIVEGKQVGTKVIDQ